MATEIGIIKTLIGTAVATASDGSQRTLQAGDKVFQDEIITTGAAGAVEVEFSDGSLMTLGRSSQTILDIDAFDPQAVAQAPTAAVDSEVDALQQALLEGADPSQIGEATAAGAGAGAGGNEGTDFVQVLYEAPEVTPESGFDTTGITVEFEDEREEDVFDDTPTAGTTIVLLDEDDIYNFAGGKGEEGHAELRAAFDAIKSDFETAEELSAHPHKANGPGLNDEQEGDDLPPDAKVFVSSLLNADFGADGPGDIVFNAEGTQPAGLTSGGEDIQYWVSADGHSLVAYIEYSHYEAKGEPSFAQLDIPEGRDQAPETHAHIIFTAEITDVETGAFQVMLLGPVDHEDGTTEDNLFVNLGFTISDLDGDTAAGVLRLDIDDDSPVIDLEGGQGNGYSSQELFADEDDLKQGNDDHRPRDDDSGYPNGYSSIHLPVYFGADGPAEVDPIIFSTDNLPELTSNGVAVTWEWVSADSQLVGSAEGTTVVTITVDHVYSNDVGINITLSDNLDHAEGFYGKGDDNIRFDVEYTATDFDGDSVEGSFSVNIDDDTPVIGNGEDSPAPEDSIVDEEFLATSATQDDGYIGDVEGKGGDFELTATGDLNISWGADDNNDDTSSHDRSVTFRDSQASLDQLELTSNGVEVEYSVSPDGTVLTATAGGTPVFTVTLSDLESGSYDFELFDNLDHSIADTEDDINLTFNFTATDSDGDAARSSFTVTVDDDGPVIGEALSEDDGNSILLGARDGSAGLEDWGVTPGALTGAVTMNGVTANISFQDNDSNPSSKLRIYNNNANHIGGGSLADNDNEGINAGETLTISFDKLMQQAEIGVDGLGNHFLPESSQQAHATWVAYKNGVEVASGEIDNPEGQNEGPEGLLEVFTVSIPGGFDTIVLGNNSNNDGSNYEVRYLQAQTLNIVDEEGLQPEGNLGDSYSDNGDVAGATLTTTADLNIIWGADDNNNDDDDGQADRSVTFDDVQSGLAGLTSNDVPVTFVLSEGDTVLTAKAGEATVFTVTLSDLESGSFDFSLLDNLDHPTVDTEDDINLTFAFTATDSDGDTVNGSFGVTVDDDGPTVGQNAKVKIDDDVLDGNPKGPGDNVDAKNVTGTLTHSFGADTEGTVLLLDSHQKSGFTYELNDDGTILTISQGETAVVEVALDDMTSGNYTVTQLAAIDHKDQAANKENNVEFRIDYQVTDGDGDTKNGKIKINVDDDTPVIRDIDDHIYFNEDDLLASRGEGESQGNDENAPREPLSVSRDIRGDVNWGADGFGRVTSIDLDGEDLIVMPETAGDDSVTVYFDETGAVTLVEADASVTLLVNENGDYTVTLNDNLLIEGAGENIFRLLDGGIQINAADGDGDEVSGGVLLKIDIKDDVPVIRDIDDHIYFNEDDLLASRGAGESQGNDENAPREPLSVSRDIRGDVNWGADGFGRVTSIDLDGEALIEMPETAGDDSVTVYFDETGAVTTVAADASVTLLVNENGDYTVTLNDNLVIEGAGENIFRLLDGGIQINAADGDGDEVAGGVLLKIDIKDDVPTASHSHAGHVGLDDDAQSGGNPGGVGDADPDSVNVTGTLAHSYGADGAGSILLLDSSQEDGFVYTLNGDSTILTISQDGTDVLKVTLDDTTSGGYTVTQLAAISHDAGDNENNQHFHVDYQVTDDDGDTANSYISINVDDDTPVVTSESDTLFVEEDDLDNANAVGNNEDGSVDAHIATGNLADNFSFGADGAAAAAIVSVNGVAAVAGTITVTTATYSLVVTASTGDYTFTLLDNVLADPAGDNGENDQSLPPIDLTVVAEDGDGDQVTGDITLDVTVQDDIPVISTISAPIVQESFENLRTSNGWHVEDEGTTGNAVEFIGDHGVVWTTNVAGIELQRGNVGGSTASDGQTHAELDSHNFQDNGPGDTTLTVLSTTVTLPGTEATLSFDYKPRPADQAGSDMKVTVGGVEVIIDGQAGGGAIIDPVVGVSITQTTSASGWITVTLSYEGLTPGETELSIAGLPDASGGSNTLGAYLDNISFDGNLSLQVDETTLSTDDSADFSGYFVGSYGADGEGSTSYAVNADQAASGLIDTATQQAVVLVASGTGIEGYTAGSNELVFVVSVDANGVVTLDQRRAVDHGEDGNDHDSVTGLEAGILSLEATITDADGDTATSSIDLGVAISFRDDGPSITATQPTEVAYEFTITNHDDVSSAGYHNSYGYYIKGDGGVPTTGVVVWDDVKDSDTVPVTVTGYTPDQIGFFIIPNGDNNNSELTDGAEVTFAEVNGQWQAFVGSTPLTGNGSHVLFDEASLNKDSQDHEEDNDLIGNQNWEDLQIPNGDGDFNDVNVNVEWNQVSNLVVDETELTESASASTSMELAGQFAISPGADGLESVVYNLDVIAPSGLVDTASNENVLLRVTSPDGDIEGYIGAGNPEDVVFTLSIDDSGVATLTQFRAVVHDDPSDHDEAGSPAILNAGAITLTAVVTDGDGDTASDSIDIGALIGFEDDGPILTADTNSDIELEVPEINLTQASPSNATTYDLGSENAGKLVTIEFDTTTVGSWDESGSNQDEFVVNVNGEQLVITNDGSDHHSLEVLADENGQVNIEFIITVTGSDEGIDVSNLTLTALGAIEDTVLTAEGNVLVNDLVGADDGEVSTTDEMTGTYGSVTIDANGDYTYLLNNAAANVQSLAQGQTVTDVFSYTVTDGDGDTAESSLTITITGTNDKPEIEVSDIAGTAVEAGNTDAGAIVAAIDATGQMVSSDVDTGATATWSHSGGETSAYGSFAITPAGAWTYTIDTTPGSAADMLNEAESYDETFVVTVTDEHGATASETVTVTIQGTNDSPIAVADAYALGDNIIVDGSFENPDVGGNFQTLGAGADLGAWDIDSGSIDLIDGYWPASEGGQSLDMSGGSAGTISQDFSTVVGNTYYVTFDLSANSDINTVVQMQVSAAGVTADYEYDASQNDSANMNWSAETFAFVATDTTTTLQFASLEANAWGPALDNVQVREVSPGFTTDEDTALTIDVLANDTDIDSDDSSANHSLDAVSFASGLPTVPTATPATVTIVNDELVFNPGTDFDYLAEGESTVVVVDYTMSDDTDAVSSTTATILVTGVNDAPEVTALNANTLEDTSITFTEAELLLGATDVDNDDTTLSVQNVSLSSGTGSVVDNGDGTWTYTPGINSDVDAVLAFEVSDGITSTPNTVAIDVIAVADAPNLIISVGNETALESDVNLIVNGSFEDVSGHDQNNNPVSDADISAGGLVNRLDITGWETTAGAPMEPHHKDHAGVGSTDGDNYMDLGASPGNSSISQVINVIEGAEYKLSFDYRDKAAMQEGGQAGEDSGVMQVLWNGVEVATVEGNNRDSWATINSLVLIGAAGTNTLTFAEIGVNDDNWGMAIDNVEMFHVPYQYHLDLTTALTDGDGSESLSSISLDVTTFPEGVYFGGNEINDFSIFTIHPVASLPLTLTSDTPLTDAQINAITASVKSTEASNSDEATTIETAKVEFDGLDASAETADLLIEGTAGADTIIGGTGDDIIFGAGDADEFVWTKSTVGGSTDSHDVVEDFNSADGDVLNLTDLLGDSSHTIEGIEVGSPGTEHLQINIIDGGNVVQEIELNGVSTGGDAAAALNALLISGAIDDGI